MISRTNSKAIAAVLNEESLPLRVAVVCPICRFYTQRLQISIRTTRYIGVNTSNIEPEFPRTAEACDNHLAFTYMVALNLARVL